jgi:large subunit ribosomal protein L3
LRGAVPGTEGGWVKIRDAIKLPAPEGVPTPGAIKSSGAQAKEEPNEASAEDAAQNTAPGAEAETGDEA